MIKDFPFDIAYFFKVFFTEKYANYLYYYVIPRKMVIIFITTIYFIPLPLPLVMHRLPLFTTRGYIESLLESQHILLERKRDLLKK